jgi:hypothetical protein
MRANKPRATREKEIKTGAEINEIEKRKTLKKNQQKKIHKMKEDNK